MENQIKKILTELYFQDEKLRSKEKELTEIIRLLLESKEAIIPDKEFKEKLLKIIEEKQLVSKKSFFSVIADRITIMSRMSYATAGALVVAIAILLTNGGGKADIIDFSKVSINSVQEKAFGDLSTLNQDSTPNASGVEDRAQQVSPIAMGMAESVAKGGGGVGGGMPASSVDAKMMPPYPGTSYTFKYTGEDTSLDDNKVTVLKRVPNESSRKQFSSILKKLNFDVMDLSSFQDSYIQNITLAEEKNYGYILNINLDEGQMSIYQNWPKWRGAYPNCNDDACWERNKITRADILPNEDLISISNKFLKDHGIMLSEYGAPEVLDNNSIYPMPLLEGSGSAQVYLPDTMTVIYPLLINGKKVYDGTIVSGVQVSINLRVKKVASVSNISVQTYQASTYEAETDFKRIISIAESGGTWGYYNNSGNKKVEIELGTPTIEYVQSWQYNPNEERGYQLIVPSLVFPLKNIPEDYYIWQKYVTVPLVKEMPDKQGTGLSQGLFE